MKRLLPLLLFAQTLSFGQTPYHLDSSFGTNGIVYGSATAQSPGISMLGIQADGRIVASSRIMLTASAPLSVLRFMPDGQADATFGASGVTNLNLTIGSYLPEVKKMKLTPTGPLLAGFMAGAGNGYFIAVKLDMNGQLNAAFGTGGKAISMINNWDLDADAAVQSDGKILLGGTTITTVYTQAHTRLNADGSPDMDYGQSGQVTNPFPVLNTAPGGSMLASYNGAMLTQPDDKLLVAGTYNSTGYSQYFIIRYKTDGTPDSSFGTDGLALQTGSPSNSNDMPQEIALDASGNIYLTMLHIDLNGNGIRVARVSPAGIIDNTYGAAGIANCTATINTQYPYWFGSALQAGGKIVIAGTTDTADQTKFSVFRFTAAGIPDAGFGTGGTLTIDRGFPDICNAVAIQSDTSIVLGGSTSEGGTNLPLLMRVNNKSALAVSQPGQASTCMMTILPNPASGEAIVRFQAGSEQFFRVRLSDVTGRRIWSKTTAPSGKDWMQVTIPLEGVAKGVYLVSLENAKGNIEWRKLEVQ